MPGRKARHGALGVPGSVQGRSEAGVGSFRTLAAAVAIWLTSQVLKKIPVVGPIMRRLSGGKGGCDGKTKTLYHQGHLPNGVSGRRPFSASPSSSLSHYRPNGQLYAFDVPEATLRNSADNRHLTVGFDSLGGVTTDEWRFSGVAAEALNEFMRKE